MLGKLRHRTSEKAIVKAMSRAFDAPDEEIRSDVHDLLEQLRRIGALKE